MAELLVAGMDDDNGASDHGDDKEPKGEGEEAVKHGLSPDDGWIGEVILQAPEATVGEGMV